MCAAALVQARMGQVFFGAKDLKRGGLGGTINLSDHKSSHHHMVIHSGILEKEAKNQLKVWFRKQRIASRENSTTLNQTS